MARSHSHSHSHTRVGACKDEGARGRAHALVRARALRGRGGAGHPREVVMVADSQTVVVVTVGWKMEAVEEVVLRTVVPEVVVLRIVEVAARGPHSKMLEFWDGGEQGSRLCNCRKA